jgi:Xaa-Pro aminopeptidase
VDIPLDEEARVESLLEAQANAAALFDAVDQNGLIAPGVREITASDAIRDLANEMFGGTRHWHKRIVRAGPNTLQPYRKNPPDRVIEADDIAFCDFGPIFDGWEADFGRTFVLGEDPVKHRLRADLSTIFEAGRQFYESHDEVTGAQLFSYVVGQAEEHGWTWGGTIAGHLVGQFPHDTIDGGNIKSVIAPGNNHPMRTVDSNGYRCHWILEIHLVDIPRQFGGFHEQLVDIGH